MIYYMGGKDLTESQCPIEFLANRNKLTIDLLCSWNCESWKRSSVNSELEGPTSVGIAARFSQADEILTRA